MPDRHIKEWYAADLRNQWYGAHNFSYAEFFRALAGAYQVVQNATHTARDFLYKDGPLAGLSGHDIVLLWEYPQEGTQTSMKLPSPPVRPRTTVVNIREGQRYDVYIGRPSKWGNPFLIGRDGTREEVIAKYKSWISDNTELMAAVKELKGKVLACFCKPEACHGDVLVTLADE
jgi:hypothetical protein